MLLEYFRPESFRQLAHFQTQENGKPVVLMKAEKSVTSVAELLPDIADEADAASDETVAENHRLPPWLDDEWTKKWLKMEPSLTSEDLRPYFYFSRDTLGSLSGIAQRMTPTAQEFLTGLLHSSEAVMKNTLQKTSTLNEAEAASVLQALCERARQESDLGDDKSAFARLSNFVKARPTLCTQFLTFVGELSESVLPPQVVTTIASFAADTSNLSAVKFSLERFSRSSNTQVKRLAKARLQKLGIDGHI
jgi:hypothetical protein